MQLIFHLLPLVVLVFMLMACSSSGSKQEKNEAIVPSPAPALAPGEKPIFKVEVKSQSGVQMVNVTFSGRLPAPESVDKILRDEFEKAVKKNPSQDALGYAYLGEDDLTPNQFAGNLVYKAAKKNIMTEDEYNGVKSSGTSNDAYYVQTEEQHTLPGITPKRTWLSISLVFPKAPSQNDSYDAIIAEIEKVKGRGLDVDAYVKVGDKNVKTSWYQVKDTDGAFIFAGYKADSKQVRRKDKLLKQF
ncbi:MAG: hypothetical protein H0V90_09980 [Blastocatellia bacterium]|nr:hypothetical protein [Blastocatellia bacterium]